MPVTPPLASSSDMITGTSSSFFAIAIPFFARGNPSWNLPAGAMRCRKHPRFVISNSVMNRRSITPF